MVDNASLRRLLVVLATPAFLLLQKKLNIDLPTETLDMVVGLAIAYVIGGNVKEAVVKKAEAEAGTKAAALTPEEAKGTLDRVAGPPASTVLALVLGGLLALTPGTARAQAEDAPVDQPALSTVCYDAAQQRRLAQHIVKLETENELLKKPEPSKTALVVLSVVAAFVVGGAVGASVALAVKQP